VIAISDGDSHALAIDANGSVWALGSNEDGELGIGSANRGSAEPLPPQKLKTLSDAIAKVPEDLIKPTAGKKRLGSSR
jgi:alpha-tubulin suppressor-like RCC1 family protein